MPELTSTKDFGTPVLNVDGTFTVPVTITVENTGDVDIDNLQLSDNLGAASNLGTAFQSIVGTPVISITDDGNVTTALVPTANGTAFDGSAQPLILAGTDGVLGTDDVLTVTFTALVDPNASGAPATLQNTATASGDDPSGTPTSDDSDSGNSGDDTGGGDDPTSLTPPATMPELTLVKAADDTTDVVVGQTVTYSYTIENTGDVNVSDITVTDQHTSAAGTSALPVSDETGDTGNSSSSVDASVDGSWDVLAPGDTVTFTATYTVTQADIDAGGDLTNTATASGTSPSGTLTEPTDTETVSVDPSAPMLTIVKSDPTLTVDADSSSSITPDDTIEYVVTVTNTGNVTLNNVIVSDALITPSSETCASVVPGDTCVLTGEYVPTTADADAGQVVNTASVTSDEVAGPTDSNTISTPVEISTATLSGVVFIDLDGDGVQDTGEDVLAGWIVKVYDSAGNVVAELTTDANGYYETDLPLGEFTVEFCNPENGTVYSSTTINTGSSSPNPDGSVSAVVNLPIDPSGVVYDSITRVPVAGVTVTMVDASGTPLPDVCFISPSQQDQVTGSRGMYQFDLVPGADPACPLGQTDYGIIFDAPASHLDTVSTIIGPEAGFLTAPAGIGPFEVAPQSDAPTGTDSTTYYLGFTLGTGSRDVIHNHIPLDPASFIRTDLTVMKSTPRRDVRVGDVVPYEIKVTNTEDLPRVDLDMVDFLPAGLRYVEDTAQLDTVPVMPVINGRELRLDDLDFAANETKVLTLMVVVGAGVSDGNYTNQAYVEDRLGAEISNRGEATVRVVPDPVFDCSEVIGKVFEDRNADGYQDEGELGIPGARLATVKGLLVTTDEHGRYHIPCAAVPNGKIGSNFILKLDERTLPTGFKMTSENPRVVRLTRGKMTKMNFGVTLPEMVSLDLTDAAFVPGTLELKPEYRAQLPALVDALNADEPVLHLNYDAARSSNQARARLDALSREIKSLWAPNRRALKIETKLFQMTDVLGGE
jgi:uncharacterized repeat protein (TIGR01451 family)